MSSSKVNPKIEVTQKEDGAIITVEGLEIEITVRPSWKTLRHPASSGELKPSVESLRMDLNPFMKDLDILERDENIIVKPKRFLGRDFPPIAEIIEYYGGSYVSEGRESRFIIPLEKSQESETPSTEDKEDRI